MVLQATFLIAVLMIVAIPPICIWLISNIRYHSKELDELETSFFGIVAVIWLAIAILVACWWQGERGVHWMLPDRLAEAIWVFQIFTFFIALTVGSCLLIVSLRYQRTISQQEKILSIRLLFDGTQFDFFIVPIEILFFCSLFIVVWHVVFPESASAWLYMLFLVLSPLYFFFYYYSTQKDRIGFAQHEERSRRYQEQYNREQQEAEKRAELEAAEEEYSRDLWKRSLKQFRCEADNLIYPYFLKERCPLCGRTDRQVAESTGYLLSFLSVDATLKKLPKQTRQSLEKRIHEALARGDYVAIGNTFVEELMCISPLGQAGEKGTFLQQMAGRVIEKRFNLPFEMAYPIPLWDECIRFQDRDSWEIAVFPQIMVCAFVLGATIQSLPDPHASFLPFYLMMAKKQKKCIEEIAKTCLNTPKPSIPRSSIQEILNCDDLSAEEKELEIIRLANGPIAKKPNRRITPD